VTGEPSRPPRRWSWRSLLRWTAIVAVTVGGSIVFDLLNVPSPSLFGGLVTGMIFALTTNWRTVLPASVNSGAQAVIGVVLGALLELSTLQSLGSDWLPVAAVIVGTLLLSVVAGLLMGRWTSVSPITGSLSLSAGGAAGVTSMSRELGADERMVAVIQYLRVVLIVSTLPLVTTFVFAPPTADSAAVAVAGGAGPAVDLLFTAVCASLGSLVAIRLKIPAGTLLGPLVLTAAVTLAGWSFGAHTPVWLAQIAYGAIGLRIGLGFTRSSLKLLRRVLPVALTLTVVIILGCAGMGLFLASATGQSPLAGYLATSPGGLFAVLAIAAETGTSATFVLAVQVLRIFVMLLVAPALAVFLSRLREPPDSPAQE
jgi:membrane AbrB-like protein